MRSLMYQKICYEWVNIFKNYNAAIMLLQNNFNGKQYLTFVPVTYVPFEPKLIRTDWLNDKQVTK